MRRPGRRRSGLGRPVLVGALVGWATLGSAGALTAAPFPKIDAASAIVEDRETGEVLFERAADETREIASLTKIMSAIVAYEERPREPVAVVSAHAASLGEATAHLRAGERVRFDDLLALMMMLSANDAAVAVAEHVAGSEQAFVARMNRWAERLGCYDTHFQNPHGLNADLHYSTARNVATMARHLLQIPEAARLVAAKELRIPRPGYRQDPMEVRNINSLLFWRPDVDGVKTGYTRRAGGCLVSSARRGERGYIVVVLGSESRFHDSDALLTWAFESFDMRRVLEPGQPVHEVGIAHGVRHSVKVTPGERLDLLLPVGQPAPAWDFRQQVHSAPIRAGAEVGTFTVWHRGVVYEVPGVAAEAVDLTWWRRMVAWPDGALLLLSAGILAVSSGYLFHYLTRSRPMRDQRST